MNLADRVKVVLRRTSVGSDRLGVGRLDLDRASDMVVNWTCIRETENSLCGATMHDGKFFNRNQFARGRNEFHADMS